jgi:adenylate cyclase
MTPDAVPRASDAPEIVEALGRVLDSRAFRRSSRSRGFLAFVVTETLAGRADRLSERTVARQALGRGPGFDGVGDASVRVQASRVRAYLEKYYASDGADDSVRIALPKGSYVPVFEWCETPPVQVTRVPGVAVAFFTNSGGEAAAPIARFLSETLVQRLSQFPDIRVVGPTEPQREGGRLVVPGDVSSLVTGHVNVRGDRLTLALRLLDSYSTHVVWSTDDVVELADLATFESQEQWSQDIAAKLGDPTGLVVRQELRRQRPTETEPELAGRLAFYSYVDRGTTSSIIEAIAVLEVALESEQRTPTLLAMRAALANASVAHGIGDRDSELELAAALARSALALDGTNAHAHLVLGSVARDRGQWDVAIVHAETAVRLAPYHPSYLVGAGITLSGSGGWQRGSQLIREAHRLHPGLSGHTHAWLAMGHLVHGDYSQALAEASLLPSEDGYVWGPLYRGMALSGLGYAEQAKAEFDRVRLMRPEILDDLGGYLSSRMRLSDSQLTDLVALL